MDAMNNLCVHRPQLPRLDVCAVTGLWAERGGGVGVQVATHQRSHGHTAHRAGHHGRAALHVCAPPSPTAPGRVAPVTGLWAECGGGVGSRQIHQNGFTGPLPAELGAMDALEYLCVHRSHPPPLTRADGVWGSSVDSEGRWERRWESAERARRGGQQRTCTRCARGAACEESVSQLPNPGAAMVSTPRGEWADVVSAQK
jgi:hypothetical protein